jgi:superfamily II DNA or RNA helicase
MPEDLLAIERSPLKVPQQPYEITPKDKKLAQEAIHQAALERFSRVGQNISTRITPSVFKSYGMEYGTYSNLDKNYAANAQDLVERIKTRIEKNQESSEVVELLEQYDAVQNQRQNLYAQRVSQVYESDLKSKLSHYRKLALSANPTLDLRTIAREIITNEVNQQFNENSNLIRKYFDLPANLDEQRKFMKNLAEYCDFALVQSQCNLTGEFISDEAARELIADAGSVLVGGMIATAVAPISGGSSMAVGAGAMASRGKKLIQFAKHGTAFYLGMNAFNLSLGRTHRVDISPESYAQSMVLLGILKIAGTLGKAGFKQAELTSEILAMSVYGVIQADKNDSATLIDHIQHNLMFFAMLRVANAAMSKLKGSQAIFTYKNMNAAPTVEKEINPLNSAKLPNPLTPDFKTAYDKLTLEAKNSKTPGMEQNAMQMKILSDYAIDLQLFAADSKKTKANKPVATTAASSISTEPAVEAKVLREYQTEVNVRAAEDRANGIKRGLVLLPTGSGKTLTVFNDAFSVMDGAWKKNPKKVLLYVVPSDQLRSQAVEDLKKYRKDLNIHTSLDGDLGDNPVVVTTFQYFHRNKDHFKNLPVTYVAIDEAHHSFAASYDDIIAGTLSDLGENTSIEYILGVTATEIAAKGKRAKELRESLGLEAQDGPLMLRELFGNRVLVDKTDPESYREFIRAGYLAPVMNRSSLIQLADPTNPNGEEFVSGGEFDYGKIYKKIPHDQINSVIWEAYRDRIPEARKDKPTKITTLSIEHSDELKQYFIKQGYSENQMGVLNSNMSDAVKNQMIKDFESGKIKILFTVGMLREGYDFPGLYNTVLGAPIYSKYIYQQEIGRLMRPDAANGKTHGLAVDVVYNFGRYQSQHMKSVFGKEGLKVATPKNPDGTGGFDPKQEYLKVADLIHKEEQEIFEAGKGAIILNQLVEFDPKKHLRITEREYRLTNVIVGSAGALAKLANDTKAQFNQQGVTRITVKNDAGLSLNLIYGKNGTQSVVLLEIDKPIDDQIQKMANFLNLTYSKVDRSNIGDFDETRHLKISSQEPRLKKLQGGVRAVNNLANKVKAEFEKTNSESITLKNDQGIPLTFFFKKNVNGGNSVVCVEIGKDLDAKIKNIADFLKLKISKIDRDSLVEFDETKHLQISSGEIRFKNKLVAGAKTLLKISNKIKNQFEEQGVTKLTLTNERGAQLTFIYGKSGSQSAIWVETNEDLDSQIKKIGDFFNFKLKSSKIDKSNLTKYDESKHLKISYRETRITNVIHNSYEKLEELSNKIKNQFEKEGTTKIKLQSNSGVSLDFFLGKNNTQPVVLIEIGEDQIKTIEKISNFLDLKVSKIDKSRLETFNPDKHIQMSIKDPRFQKIVGGDDEIRALVNKLKLDFEDSGLTRMSHSQNGANLTFLLIKTQKGTPGIFIEIEGTEENTVSKFSQYLNLKTTNIERASITKYDAAKHLRISKDESRLTSKIINVPDALASLAKKTRADLEKAGSSSTTQTQNGVTLTFFLGRSERKPMVLVEMDPKNEESKIEEIAKFLGLKKK